MQRFTDKKWLTKLVDRDGWIAYRDSENGMYIRNDELKLDYSLNMWNITRDSSKLDSIIAEIREDIDMLEAEYEEEQAHRDDILNRKIVIRENPLGSN